MSLVFTAPRAPSPLPGAGSRSPAWGRQTQASVDFFYSVRCNTSMAAPNRTQAFEFNTLFYLARSLL
jgi:hypothetical protein